MSYWRRLVIYTISGLFTMTQLTVISRMWFFWGDSQGQAEIGWIREDP